MSALEKDILLVVFVRGPDCGVLAMIEVSGRRGCFA